MPELVVTTADGYTTANTYGPFAGASLTSVQAWTNPIALQLFYGPQGSSALTSEETLVPGIIQQYEGATGARVRSQTPGAPATVKINVYLPGTGQAGGLPQPLTPVTAGGGPGSFNITVGGSPVTVDNNLPIVVNNSISDPVNVTVPITETINITIVPTPVVDPTNHLNTFATTAVTNTAQSVKVTAGNLYGWFIHNPDPADDAFLNFYDVLAASVIVGTTIPRFSLWIPSEGAVDDWLPNPMGFVAAISISATLTISGGAAPSTALEVQPIAFL